MRSQLTLNAAQSGDDLNAGGSQLITLKPFALPAGRQRAATSSLFARTNGDALPMFSENAKVRAIKPGAETLAVSGSDAADILLARQQFGDGFTAALTTDLLWRWKMSLPSGSHAVEKFWQQLLLSLAPATGQGFQVAKLTALPAVNVPAVFSITAAVGASPPKLEALSPSGGRQRLTVVEAGDAAGPGWQASFIPTTTGRWEVRALDAAGHTAGVAFTVAKKNSSTEMLNLPADLAGMQQLAESTGGALVEPTTVFPSFWETAAKPPAKLPEPMWNSGVLLLVLLGFYTTELILRRRFKLL